MRNRTVFESNGDHILLGIFDAFTDSFRNFSSFAEACAYFAFAIADYYNCSKLKTTAAFYDFSNAVNENNVFL